MHIGIIGAGISGLVTAKTFIAKGHKVTLFEKSDTLGGVWNPSRSYPNVTTQTTRDEYSFSDFPMPSSYPDWPSGAQVHAYLSDYAQHFDVVERIRYRSEVTAVEPLSQDGRHRGFRLTANTQSAEAKTPTTQDFDFIVICNGVFHQPKKPAVSGIEEFVAGGGEVLHSSEFVDPARISGKKLIVVGFAKSATDIATYSLGRSKSTTLVYRKAYWKVPRYFGNAVSLRYVLFSRFSEAFFAHYAQSSALRILHSIGKPLVWMHWRTVENLLRRQMHLDACDMVPTHSIEDQISCSLSIAPPGFYEAVRDGKIQARRTTLQRFFRGGLELASGEHLDADMVIFGTGYTQGLPFLANSERSKLVDEEGFVHLYRNLIHPDVSGLAFNGYNSSLFCPLTSEVGARWIAEYAEQKLRLPSRDAMLLAIAKDILWRKQDRRIAAEFGGTCIAPFNFHYLDALLQDMGAKTRARNPLSEGLLPINPTLFARLLRTIP